MNDIVVKVTSPSTIKVAIPGGRPIAVSLLSKVIKATISQRGLQGIPGVSGDIANSVVDEQMTGVVNNSNTTFTSSFNFESNTTHVYYNGIRQRKGLSNDYTESGNNTIIFNVAPKKGVVTMDYKKVTI